MRNRHCTRKGVPAVTVKLAMVPDSHPLREKKSVIFSILANGRSITPRTFRGTNGFYASSLITLILNGVGERGNCWYISAYRDNILRTYRIHLIQGHP